MLCEHASECFCLYERDRKGEHEFKMSFDLILFCLICAKSKLYLRRAERYMTDVSLVMLKGCGCEKQLYRHRVHFKTSIFSLTC